MPRDFDAFLGGHLSGSRFPALRPQGSCGRIFGNLAKVFLDLAGEDLGDPNRIGDGIGGSFLALRSFRYGGSEWCFTLSLPANSLAGLEVHQPKKVGRAL